MAESEGEFKFNFAVTDVDQEPAVSNANPPQCARRTDTLTRNCTELVAPASTLTCGAFEELEVAPGILLHKVCVGSDVAAMLSQSESLQANDVVAGQYEGGFKLWEGGHDLAAHVAAKWLLQSASLCKGPAATVDSVPGSLQAPQQAAMSSALRLLSPSNMHLAGDAAAANTPDADDRESAHPLVQPVSTSWPAAVATGLCASVVHSAEGPAAVLGGNQVPSQPTLANMRVLELGCGAGLPGLVALLGGAQVVFQDFDQPVLEHVTIPNVLANCSQVPPAQPVDVAAAPALDHPASITGEAPYTSATTRVTDAQSASVPRARFVAGAWTTFSEWLLAEQLVGCFDVVLTAETIYDLRSMPDLLACIRQALRPDGGICYVAAKTYYFGVGGSTAAFRDAAEAQQLRVWTEAIIDDGKSNKREILGLSC